MRATPRRWKTSTPALFFWALLAVGLSIGAWTLATPLGAAPDEPSHVIEATAAVRGQIDVPEFVLKIRSASVGRVGVVGVPKWATRMLPACFLGKSNVPASCAPAIGNSTKTVVSATQFARYPPLYYLIVGLPSLLATGRGAIYGMQFTAAILDAALIALGLFLLARYHPRRLCLLASLVALSPMVFFISGVVNSSGMETAAAFAAWCGCLCVVTRSTVPKGLALWTGVSFAVLILSRPISPINAAVILAVSGTLVGWNRVRAALRNRNVRPALVSIAIATALFGVCVITLGVPAPLGVGRKPPMGLIGNLWLTLQLTGSRLRQCIGNFGWLDAPAPTWVIVVWTVALVGLLIYGLVVSPRCRRALPLLALSILAMPLIFESPRINAVGLYWQGRYWLPLVVGLPLVASSIEPKARQRARSVLSPGLQLLGFVGVGAILVVAQVAAFLTAIHRYETGLGVPAGTTAKWTPLGGTSLTVSLFVVGEILLLGFVTWQYAGSNAHLKVPKTSLRSNVRT